MTDLPQYAHAVKPQYTVAHNPSFTVGQRVDATEDGKTWIEGEKAGWKVVDTAAVEPLVQYQLMISGIVPRPVAFVSSIGEDGVENLAPFSWFNMVTHNPPVISISVASNPTTKTGLKDTAANIKATKGFVVNIISETFVENANFSCIDAPTEVSEWPLTGLTKVPSDVVKPPRVKESAFSMECELFQTVDIIHPETKKHTTTLVLGLVKRIHVRNDTLNERGNVDITKLRPISRNGDISYARVGDSFRIPRPAWSVEGEKIGEFLKGVAESGKL
ncbi:uncharacterized protein BXZ73DRAFT_49698 [Epithele typhae]|uniref:uncharacterized protein n=1 Tax=Epithele typhae TaxID=378194 RepID=UPI002008BAD3|nr:uncharacterized protein BXZ73DRAFT_49698 [Epithele typhae]KAH9925854.1 hypothetical protein BXZ73DRAFT_49698 [Epithele typhae]